MNKRERAELVQQILDEKIPHPEIPLRHSSPYTLLIAVLLSAQCTDARVNEITPRLFALASTPQEMTQLSVDEIVAIIRPCGLAPTKGRAIHRLSEILLERYGGRVPRSGAALRSLPGVGRKTASVVLAQAFHQPAFPVDTHIHRCAHRWGLSSGKNVETTERELKRIFPRRNWARLHLQIILFARQFCPARGHHPLQCPICSIINN